MWLLLLLLWLLGNGCSGWVHVSCVVMSAAKCTAVQLELLWLLSCLVVIFEITTDESCVGARTTMCGLLLCSDSKTASKTRSCVPHLQILAGCQL
jgi:hypothetical protein